MSAVTEIVIAIIGSMLASSGLWSYLMYRSEKKDVRTQLLIGLAHDRIMERGMFYIERGYITFAEYENLCDYLYKPYKKMGGNGSADKIMEDVQKLPMRNA